MSDDLSHWEKFQPSGRTIRTFDHWLVVVRPKQVTLGSAVFLLKRAVTSMSEMTAGELSELAEIAAWYERRLREVFNAEKFNYIAAMMKDPYFHFHAIPRYGAEREFNGRSWADADWPAVATFRDVDTSDDDIQLIREALES